MASVLAQTFPPKSKFSADQVPDLTGRVAIVTGGNSGVGREIVKVLLEHNARVYMASRSKDKADQAVDALKIQTGKDAIFLELDLANLTTVRRAAEEFLSNETELHMLFNNAGIMYSPVDQLTADGYDLQLGTNVIGTSIAARACPVHTTAPPALLTGTQSSPDGHARVIFTSSSTAYSHAINWDALATKDGPARRRMSTQDLYSQSKFAGAVIAREFARRYGDKGIVAVSANPGNVRTELARNMRPYARRLLHATFYPAAMGALTPIWGATMPDTLAHNGEFLIPWARIGRCRRELYEDALGERLWDWMELQLKGR
ncbi:NAD(P)-binding protein [Amylocystis lapponica]|nr:NAD(P)-binding protein [Amylocystis lapponica]